MKTIHRGMGSDLMAFCGAMEGISGTDQVRLSYVDEQVTCIACLQKRVKELMECLGQKDRALGLPTSSFSEDYLKGYGNDV